VSCVNAALASIAMLMLLLLLAPLFSVRSYSGFFYEGDLSMGHQRPWFLSFTFAVACCVIVSGCLAERTRLVVSGAHTCRRTHRAMHVSARVRCMLVPSHSVTCIQYYHASADAYMHC
jgi:hypothetical protein